MIDLKNEDLRSFLAINRAGTFSSASRETGLTQSALSQKVARLEELLHSTLFIRHPRSLELTPAGEKLYHYAKDVLQLQEDFLQGFDQYKPGISGHIRIASYSSINRSLVIPKFKNFLTEHQAVDIQFSSHEMFELESILKSNKSDFIITDYFPALSGAESIEIEREEYVIIKSRLNDLNPQTFLDHGPLDNATHTFFEFQGFKRTFERRFMGDVYSIIDGVKMGLGRAVMSKHLIIKDKDTQIVKSPKKYDRPIVLSWTRQNYYSPLHHHLITLFKKSLK